MTVNLSGSSGSEQTGGSGARFAADRQFSDVDTEVPVMANAGNRGAVAGGSSGGSQRGFAAMDQEKQRKIASKGGSASGGNFARDPERAREAGRKGGEVSGGNFANDPQRAAAAGRKGGEASRVSGHRNPGGDRDSTGGDRGGRGGGNDDR